MSLAVIMARFRLELAGLFLNPIQLLDQCQPSVRITTWLLLTLRFDGITELASCMGHTTHVRKTIYSNDRVVAIITIRLQIALEDS